MVYIDVFFGARGQIGSMHILEWMYVVLLVPLGIAILLWVAVKVHLMFKGKKKFLIKTVETFDGRRFSLYADMAEPGVAGWYVYDVSAGISEDVTEPGNPSTALMWSISHASYDPEWAHSVELRQDRYLIVTGGDIYLSLYDIMEGKTLVHRESPQTEYAAWAAGNDTEADFEAWARRQLHEPIEQILKAADSH